MKVVAGIVENEDGEVLLAERPPGKHLAGLWEFPGGKLELGESLEAALTRELQEELHLDVDIVSFIGTFPFNYPNGSIELFVFHVRARNEPRATDDVQRFRWLKPQAIEYVELAPADIEPLRAFLTQSRKTM